MNKAPEPRPQDPRGPSDRVYVVNYRMKGEEGRNPRRMTVNAINQTDAVKAAKATVPGALIVGGPQELSEGLRDFAKTVGEFLSRCVGRGCLGYARSPMNAQPNTISHVRKMTTREIAKKVGERLMKIGGAEGEYKKVKIINRKPKKRKHSGRKRSNRLGK